jgi:hypothetical protein
VPAWQIAEKEDQGPFRGKVIEIWTKPEACHSLEGSEMNDRVSSYIHAGAEKQGVQSMGSVTDLYLH